MLKERGGGEGVKKRERFNQAINRSSPPDLEQEACCEDDGALFT